MAETTVRHLGLTDAEALARLQRFGPNALPQESATPLWQRFLSQFQSPLIYVLLFALLVSTGVWLWEGARGLSVESIAIALILLLNAALGVYQESKSEAALARLKEMSAPLVWAVREGSLQRLPGSVIVPGDLVRIEAGDRVPADGSLIAAEGTMLDESILTGESVPIEKSSGDTVFSGTLLVRGKTYLEVTLTGVNSSMGRLALLIGEIEREATPLEQRLEKFGGQIARAVLVLVVFIAIGGVMVEGWARISHVFLFAVALAVAAVPEGLPAVLTLTLALGVERMTKRRVVVRRLSAVEALGSVTVIATDKTGTLTENRIFVRALDSTDTQAALHAMIFANDAEVSGGAGDPLDLALLEYATKQGMQPGRLRMEYPRHDSRPFYSAEKFMRVTVIDGLGYTSYLKGAPEVVIARSLLSDSQQGLWLEKADAYAREGYRVLALGRRSGAGEDALDFLGLALMWDPPRPEVPDAIRRAREAGIRVVMVTGDHPATALSVAHEVGIAAGRVLTGSELETMSIEHLREAVRETNIFARVSPEHKLRLVDALKQNGEIVAMTGDGINDAPALKRSDVSVAMGERGSDVAREVADLVLMDDNFAAIVAAIEEGRNIYQNIQKFIRFLFSTNFDRTLLVVGGAIGAALMGLHDETGAILLPLTAVQLLWVNIVTDGPPALALGLDRDSGVMRQRPRDPISPLLDRDSWRFILTTGCIKAAMGGLLLLSMPLIGFTVMETRTAIFLHGSIGQLFYAYAARRINAPPRFNGVLHLAVILGVGLQLLTVVVPALRTLLGLEPLTLRLLVLVSAAVGVTWIAAEVYSYFAGSSRKRALQP